MVPGNSRAEALATIEALAEVRAQLWSDPTSGDLSLLDVSGSPAWESDTADRAARAQAGVRLEGLAFEVIQAQPEVEGPDTLTGHLGPHRAQRERGEISERVRRRSGAA